MARVTKSGQSILKIADNDKILSFNISVEDDYADILSTIPDSLQFKIAEMSELKLGFGDESDALFSSTSTIDISLHFENVDGFEIYKAIASQTESLKSQIIISGWQELMDIDIQTIKYDFIQNVFSATFELGVIPEKELEIDGLDSYTWVYKNIDNRYSAIKYAGSTIVEVLAANVVYRTRYVSVKDILNYLLFDAPTNKINFNEYRLKVELINGTTFDTSINSFANVYLDMLALLRDGKSYKQIISNILRAFSAKLVFSPLTGISFIPNWSYKSSENIDSSRMISIEPFIISKKDKYLFNIDYIPYRKEVYDLADEIKEIEVKNRDLEDTNDFEKIQLRIGNDIDPTLSNWVVYDFNKRMVDGALHYTRVASLKNAVVFTTSLMNHKKDSMQLHENGVLKKIYANDYNNLFNHAQVTSLPYLKGTVGFKIKIHGLYLDAMHKTFSIFGKKHRVINLVINYTENTTELTLI